LKSEAVRCQRELEEGKKIMTLDDIGQFLNAMIGLICLILIIGIVICMMLMVYFYLTEKPAQVQLTEAERKQIDEKYQEQRTNHAIWLTIAGGIILLIGSKVRNGRTLLVGLIFILAALFYDYHMVLSLVFLYYAFWPIVIGIALLCFFGKHYQ
jgi:hypothetical protein